MYRAEFSRVDGILGAIPHQTANRQSVRTVRDWRLAIGRAKIFDLWVHTRR